MSVLHRGLSEDVEELVNAHGVHFAAMVSVDGNGMEKVSLACSSKLPAEPSPAWNAGRVSHERQSETHVTPSLTLLGFTFVKTPVVLDGDIFDHFLGFGLTPLH